MNNTFRVISNLVSAAESIIAKNDDYEYIYDPEHKKHPGGGYTKTENGWQKGKKDDKDEKSENKSEMTDEQKESDKPKTETVDSKITTTLAKFSKEQKQSMAKDPECPDKVLNHLVDEKDDKINVSVANNKNASAGTLEKLSNDKYNKTRIGVAKNENCTPEILSKLSNDEDRDVITAVAGNKNSEPETLEYIHDKITSNYIGDEQDDYALENIAKNKNAKSDTLDQLAQKFSKGTAIGDAARENLKSRGEDVSIYDEKPAEPTKLPKFKFKGDDKTAPIIRAKFEKNNDEEETNTIYGEMAKFSRDDVAPMGAYHGRSKEQLKADFIKNMNPANYSSPEAYKNAKDRVQKLSAQDFSRMLASIFADEEEEA